MRDLVCADGCGAVIGWVTILGNLTVTGDVVHHGQDEVTEQTLTCFSCWAWRHPDQVSSLEATRAAAEKHRARIARKQERAASRRRPRQLKRVECPTLHVKDSFDEVRHERN